MDAWEFIIIIFWVTIILFILVGVYLSLINRKMSKKIEKMQVKLDRNLDTINQMKKNKEKRFQELVEIHNKVDKMIEAETNKL